MEFFSKNRVLGWIIIAGLAINIAAISTILYKVYSHSYYKGRNEGASTFHQNPREFIRKELNLNSEQEQKFKEIKELSKEEAKAIFIKMREQRKDLLAALTVKNPDTVLINKYIVEIEKSQSQLLHHTVKHYQQLKNVLREDQYQKLNLLFLDMFGCEKGIMSKRRGGKKCGVENSEEGEGMRHRHGKENACKNDF